MGTSEICPPYLPLSDEKNRPRETERPVQGHPANWQQSEEMVEELGPNPRNPIC